MFGVRLLGREHVWARWLEACAGAFLFGALTALAARVVVPIPGTPVPLTLQVLAVLLAGLVLGGERGALSQLLYLGAGLMGLPVFASGVGPATLFGPTGGYLLAFPVAAFVAGRLSHWLNHLPGRLLATLSGVAVIYAGGMAWLTLWLGMAEGSWGVATLARAWRLGVLPFILVDLAKGVLAALVAPRTRGEPKPV
ncbi:MAG: biotin transporter BioY [Anaerolineae bacterium]